MKLVIIEPLGVNDEKLLSMAKDMLPADLEIVFYNTRVTDTETLIERGRDADIIAVSNLPMNADGFIFASSSFPMSPLVSEFKGVWRETISQEERSVSIST